MTIYKTTRYYDGVEVKWLVTGENKNDVTQFDTQEEANENRDECNEGVLFRGQMKELSKWFLDYEEYKTCTAPLPTWVREFLPGAKDVPDYQLATTTLAVFVKSFKEELLPEIRPSKELDDRVLKMIHANNAT